MSMDDTPAGTGEAVSSDDVETMRALQVMAAPVERVLEPEHVELGEEKAGIAEGQAVLGEPVAFEIPVRTYLDGQEMDPSGLLAENGLYSVDDLEVWYKVKRLQEESYFRQYQPHAYGHAPHQ